MLGLLASVIAIKILHNIPDFFFVIMSQVRSWNEFIHYYRVFEAAEKGTAGAKVRSRV